jgi:hypothetical protein
MGISEAKGRSPRNEAVILGVFLLCFTAYNFITGAHFPLPWQDEDQFTDVAANFALGHGFTSSVWTCGDHNIAGFFACNAPLYPLVNGLWIRTAGFTVLGVRSFNYLLISLSCFVLWLAVRRLGLIEEASSRLLLAPLIVAGYGLGINYRSGRYDCLDILLCSAVLLAASIKSPPWRLRLIALGGALLPFAGFQLLPYAVLMSIVLLVVLRLSVLWEVLALGVGVAMGVAALIGMYSHMGVLHNFFASVHGENPSSYLVRFTDPEKRSERLPKDPSLIFAYLALMAIGVQQAWERKLRLRSMLGFGLVAGAFVPVAMILVFKFTTYYTWMAYIPICIALMASASKLSFRARPLTTGVAGLCIAVGCLLGFPLQAASAFYYWHDRDMRPVEAMVAREVGPRDWVYTDYAAYFAVKARTPYVFIPFDVSPQYRDKITVLILAPGDYEQYAHAIVGGDWYETGDDLNSSGHDVVKRSFAILLQRRNDFRVFKRIPPGGWRTLGF